MSKDDLAKRIMREWLHNEMSEISEDCYAAGWMCGTEHVIWRAAENLPESTDWGMGTIDALSLVDIKAASELLGEWSTCDRFVPLNEWREIHEAWLADNRLGAE